MLELKRLFVGSMLYQYNMKLIHWNCCGCDFDAIHDISEELSCMFAKNLDEIAEIMMMFDCKPLDVCNAIKCAESDNINYFFIEEFEPNAGDAFMAMSFMMNHMLELYDAATKCELPADVLGVLQAQQYEIRKANLYKNKRRLHTPVVPEN